MYLILDCDHTLVGCAFSMVAIRGETLLYILHSIHEPNVCVTG